MAERRMFAKTIVLSDAFLDMPLSARCLYFTLGMFADDDGFVNAPKAIMRQCGASEDDLKLLIAKKFIIIFESGVIVIKHWRINNYLRNDRYQETKYSDEKTLLSINQNGAYTLSEHSEEIPGIPNSGIPNSVDTQNRLGKDSIGKDSIGNNKRPSGHVFVKPSVDDVKAYCEERNNGIDAEAFIDFYESKGWKIGKDSMKDWKAAVRNWERSKKERAGTSKSVSGKSSGYSGTNASEPDTWKYDA